jgi:hypothetical protein
MNKEELLKLELKETVRYLLLPLSEEKENEIIIEIIELYGTRYEKNEIPLILRGEISDWQNGKKCTSDLKTIISSALGKIDTKYSDLLSTHFFNLFDKIDTRIALEFNQKLVLFSYIPLIINLLDEYRMSCAKIASIINQFDNRLEYITWREIQIISSEFNIKPSLVRAAVEHITEIDKIYQNHIFADADISEASQIVGEKAKELGFQGNLEQFLLTLSNETFFPYIQILHYQSVISEFYDHRVSVVYEFSPRGDIPNWIFNLYEGVATGNPFLNNAKAVDTLDKNWANSRKSNVDQAFALVDILNNIDLMNFNSSNELSGWLRRWIFRLIELNNDVFTILEQVTSIDEVNRIIESIIVSETNTYGIIEQRIIDYMAVQINNSNDWRSRGIADSVHANNYSKRKLGDCDFQNSQKLIINAYEAHAGVLSKNYIESHLKTLPRLVDRRAEELNSIADLEKWELEVEFIAHTLKEVTKIETQINGLNIKIIFSEYNDFYKRNKIVNSVENFNSIVIDVLNQKNTPNYVRDQFISRIIE